MEYPARAWCRSNGSVNLGRPANAIRIAHVAADFDEPDSGIEQMFGGDMA